MTLRTRTINRRYGLERRTALDSSTETWLGFDNVLHRAVSVVLPRQELLRDGPFLADFLQRSRIATALHHRGIVAAFDSGEDGDLPYLVTEYLGGETLTEIIRAESPFDVDDVAVLIEQLAGALDYAHQRGFVHGRLSPGEVIVDAQGAAKLLGLGVPIGTVERSETDSNNVPFTLETDIWGLAAIAFEMLTGEEPGAVEADSAGEAYLIDPDVPRNASDIVAIALAGGSSRFGSAGAFARALSGWRSFDPGAYYVPSEPVIAWSAGSLATAPAPRPTPPVDDDLLAWVEDSIDQQPLDPVRSSSHRTRWLLVATLVLMLATGLFVWRNSDRAIDASATLPAPVESLAHLSGF